MPETREWDFTGSVRWLHVVMGFVLLWALAIPVAALFTPVPWFMWVGLVIVLVVLGVQYSLVRHELVRSAVLDGDRLLARTVNGQEHVVDLDGIEVSNNSSLDRMVNGFTTVRHPGGTLWMVRPAANELLDRLHRARTDR